MESNDSKYYTPSIEEFHIGFEYEYFEEDIWKEFTLPFLNNYVALWHSNPDLSLFRVKYLDKNDVESLGFIITKEQNKAFKGIKEFNYEYDGSNIIGNYTLIQSGDHFCSITKDCMGISSLFRGEIKNFSELKTLLKQIGIL